METFTKTKLAWAQTGALRSFEEFPAMEPTEVAEFRTRGTSRGLNREAPREGVNRPTHREFFAAQTAVA